MKMKTMTVLAALGIAAQTFAAVTVTNVVCKQRYPWNGLVDIDYEILSDDAEGQYFVYPKGEDRRLGTPIIMHTLSGDGAIDPVGVGQHRMIWDAKADMPAFHTSDFAVTIQAISQGAQYLVVDLSGGTNAVTYPVRYSTTPPDITTDKCRTTELWLRLVLPGTFMMGSPETEKYRSSNEQQHVVRLTRPYYIGVFEITQKQWMLISGTTNAVRHAGDCRPIDKVSYNMVRGSYAGAKWPQSDTVDDNTFIGVLRHKSSLKFDLPTEAQWEYACRAGTTNRWNNGIETGDYDPSTFGGYPHSYNLAKLGRYTGNTGDGRESYKEHTKVGSYLPNDLGIYDMHGNVREWCRDAYKTILPNYADIDPVGADMVDVRSIRNGSFRDLASLCRSARRNGLSPSTSGGDGDIGFRVVCLPVE